MPPSTKKPLKNGLVFVEGNTRAYVAASAAKILKSNKKLSANTKKTLERVVRQESKEGVAQYQVIYKNDVIAKTQPFAKNTKSQNGYKKLFANCKKVEVNSLIKNLHEVVKNHSTASSCKDLITIRGKTRETFHVRFWVRGKSKPVFEASLSLWLYGMLYSFDLKKAPSANDMIKNLKYTIKTLAKAA